MLQHLDYTVQLIKHKLSRLLKLWKNVEGYNPNKQSLTNINTVLIAGFK